MLSVDICGFLTRKVLFVVALVLGMREEREREREREREKACPIVYNN